MCLQCVIVICVIAMYAIETVLNEQNAAEKVCEQDEFENTQMKNWNACLNFPFIFMHVASLRTYTFRTYVVHMRIQFDELETLAHGPNRIMFQANTTGKKQMKDNMCANRMVLLHRRR